MQPASHSPASELPAMYYIDLTELRARVLFQETTHPHQLRLTMPGRPVAAALHRLANWLRFRLTAASRLDRLGGR